MSARGGLIELMLHRFGENFAATAATKIIDIGVVDELYLLATDNSLSLPKAQKQMIIFRSAYTLEYIYFNYHNLFIPFQERFLTDFTFCQNSSAKRHFSKIMADILKYNTPNFDQIESIAKVAVNWVADPRIRVAVKIWSMSILKILRHKIVWLNEIWEDLEVMLINNATPAIEARLRRGWE